MPGLLDQLAPRVATVGDDVVMPVAPNLLCQDFTVERPDEKWGADISYVWTREGWLYVAVFGGIGYSAGAGGTGVQATSKSTTVALDKVTGTITLNNGALAANANVSFTWTNAAIDAGDRISWQHESGGTIGAYAINAIAGAGSPTVTVRNITGGSLSEAPVFGFTVLKGSNS